MQAVRSGPCSKKENPEKKNSTVGSQSCRRVWAAENVSATSSYPDGGWGQGEVCSRRGNWEKSSD